MTDPDDVLQSQIDKQTADMQANQKNLEEAADTGQVSEGRKDDKVQDLEGQIEENKNTQNN